MKARKNHFKKHQLFYGVMLALFVCAGGFNGWYYYSTNAAVQEASRQSEASLKKLDTQIAQIKEAKQLEQKKRDEQAAQEAKKQAEAKKDAEASANGNSARQGAASSGGGCNQSSAHNNPASIDVLVNKKHCLIPLSFVPPDLVTSNGATLSAKAINDYNRMFAAAANAGQGFYVTSSYRSYSTQVSTYNYWVQQDGKAAADTYSARPGFSEHQTGLVIDVAANGCTLNCFGSTSQYQWFQANAAQYGFIQRYYAGYTAITGYTAEEWHYRYVGVAVAQDMKAKGIKTLEQYWGMEGGDYR